MSRILEEKFRQRSTSTGSLDGMVITRDNKLISLPSEAHYELARAAAAAMVNSPQVGEASIMSETVSNKHINWERDSVVTPLVRSSSTPDRSVNQSPVPVGEMNCSRVSDLFGLMKLLTLFQ